MNFLKSLPLPGWLAVVVRAAPLIVLGILIAAIVVQRQNVIRVTGERDRIIRVVDPTGKASPDQAIALAQGVLMERNAAKAALTVTTANYRRATADAQAADLSHARAVEQHDAATSGRIQHDLEVQIASARADADDYARRLRARDTAAAAAGTDRGGSGGAGVSRPADAAGGAALPDPATQLADVRACAVNTAVAAGWQRWWSEVSATPR